MLVEKDLRRLRAEARRNISPLLPQELYEERVQRHVKNATGVEKMLYGFVPFSLIKSFAIAIDPVKKFRAVPVKISPVSRTRYRTRSSILAMRYASFRRTVISCTRVPNYQGILGKFGPEVCSTDIGWQSYGPNKKGIQQPDPVMTTKDTTMRTRPIGSNYGEFEHFEYTVNSPPQSFSKSNRIETNALYPGGNLDKSLITWKYTWNDDGPAAYLTVNDLNYIQEQEFAYATQLMQKSVTDLLAKVMPLSRRYSLFRNVVELRDVPRMILSMKESAVHLFELERAIARRVKTQDVLSLARRSLSDLPNEWVSYWFGWHQLYRDVTDLVEKPLRAAREVNRLLERSGKPTSYRIKREVLSSETGYPAFRYDSTADVDHQSLASSFVRKTELRLVINATFDFPPLNVPYFKRQLFLEKMGVYPRATDIYNLIPWSWLLDWFTGLGNYIDAIDVINTDPSLVNYGMLTAVSRGKLTTIRKTDMRSTNDVRWIPDPGVHTESVSFQRHTSTLETKFQVRRNITSAFDVKTILEPSQLTPLQGSILSSLLLARASGSKVPRMGRS